MEDPVPHGRRLRIGRFSQPHGCYLVTTLTYRRIPLFRDLTLARLLVQVRESQPLSRIIQYAKAMSARRINALRLSAGEPVWQKGFHDHAVRKEDGQRSLARYVVANPLRWGGWCRALVITRCGNAVWLVGVTFQIAMRPEGALCDVI